jgi:acetyl-CoA/propionyl-CoA carboxylase, biotin carboxylase, biotin carboxyl carrier protein
MRTAPGPLRFKSVLVANRGEIALRVFRTCRRLGLRTIALYTDTYASAPHVRAADAAVQVPSYLDIDAVLAAAIDTGTDVVHPGYGFLSERASFAAAFERKKITLVGPRASPTRYWSRRRRAAEGRACGWCARPRSSPRRPPPPAARQPAPSAMTPC